MKKKKPDLFKLIWLFFFLKGVALFLHLVNLPICTSICILDRIRAYIPLGSWKCEILTFSAPAPHPPPPPALQLYIVRWHRYQSPPGSWSLTWGPLKQRRKDSGNLLVMVVVESRASGSREQTARSNSWQCPPLSLLPRMTVGLGHGCRASSLVLSVILWACSLHLISSFPESVSIFTTKNPLVPS